MKSVDSSFFPSRWSSFYLLLLGTWNETALTQVAREFTLALDTGFTVYQPPNNRSQNKSKVVGAAMNHQAQCLELLHLAAEIAEKDSPSGGLTLRDAVVAALVSIHNSAKDMTLRLARQHAGRQHYLSPRSIAQPATDHSQVPFFLSLFCSAGTIWISFANSFAQSRISDPLSKSSRHTFARGSTSCSRHKPKWALSARTW
jgi:hypothetical protein